MTGGEAGTGSDSRLTEWGARAGDLLRRGRGRPSPRVARALQAASVVLFIGAAIVAYQAFPETDRGARWPELLIAGVVGVPLAVALNAVEFQATARILNLRMGPARALRTTVLGSAANVLPIPGSAMVRVQVLARDGATYGKAIGASAVVGGVLVATTLGVAGLFQVAVARFVLGGALVTSGAMGLLLSYGMLRRQAGREHAHRTWPTVLMIEVAFVVVGGARLWLVLQGLGVNVGLADAVALTVAGAVSTATGFFPAGLGLREVLVAGVAPLAGLPAAAGVAASVVDRLMWFALLAVLAGAFTIAGPQGSDPRSESPRGDSAQPRLDRPG